MNKLLLCGALTVAVFSYSIANAQYRERYDRAGIYASLGVNNINNTVESEAGRMQSLKGNMSVMPSIGGFYELDIDKNFSMMFSGGLAFNNFSYTYTPEYSKLSYTLIDTLGARSYYPDAPVGEVKRSYNTIMFQPQMDICLMSNPIKGTAIIDFRLGLGAGIYLKGHKNTYGESFYIKDDAGYAITYYYQEQMEMGRGNSWASTYTSLYLGLRWRNTTSNFLNRSTIGIQAFLPFDNYNVGKTTIEYHSIDWNTQLQEESAKFKLNTIGLKYTFSFTPTSR